MPVELIMEPGTTPKTWEGFCEIAPRRSIAIDGYVIGPPRHDKVGLKSNLNHHEGVGRAETRATCAQALMGLRQSKFSRFVDELGRPCARIYALDCDEDVCLTWFILKHRQLALNADNPRLNRLVYIEDVMDTTMGTYPFPKYMPSLGEVNWVFEPYRIFRFSGRLDLRIPEEFARVVYDVEMRIMAYLEGKGGKLPVDTRYEILRQEKDWCMVREIGFNARFGLFADGINAFLSVRECADGRYSYVAMRQSDDVGFETPSFIDALNLAEAKARLANLPGAGSFPSYQDIFSVLGNDLWGGGTNMACSPRISKSVLSPDEVAEIINECQRIYGM